MRSQRTPVLVALAAIGTLAIAGACGPRDAVPHPSQCPTSGCVVPAPSDPGPEGIAPDDPAYAVMACLDTGNKGPCRAIAPDTAGVCRWWFVDIGHQLYDGTARNLGEWALGAGEECV